MSWRYPLSTLAVPEEDVQAVVACLEEGWLTMGPRTQAFEAALASELGAEHVACVSSGTSALHLSCIAAGLGPGDEVIVPSMASVATASAIRCCGADPVLCDVLSPTSPTLDSNDVAQRITPRTKAVIASHFCGYGADVDALGALCEERGLLLIEDATQAIEATVGATGAKAGTVGAIGCLSFSSSSPESQLCVGEGGAVLTADADMDARVRSLRSHAMTSGTWDRHRGYSQTYDVIDVGFNFRLDEPRAALGLSRLPRLAGEIEERRRVVGAYRERLGGLAGVELPWSEEDVDRASHFAFALLAESRERRDGVRAALAEGGVQTTWHLAIHRFTDYADAHPEGSLPRTEETAARHLCLPLSPSMDEDDLQAVCAALERALES